jgi:hypothetical protein
MLGGCLPCWPKRKQSRPRKPTPDREKNQVVSASDQQLVPQRQNEDNELGPPTKQEYATAAVESIFVVLEAVSSEIPFPGVATAVKAASALLKACGVWI